MGGEGRRRGGEGYGDRRRVIGGREGWGECGGLRRQSGSGYREGIRKTGGARGKVGDCRGGEEGVSG